MFIGSHLVRDCFTDKSAQAVPRNDGFNKAFFVHLFMSTVLFLLFLVTPSIAQVEFSHISNISVTANGRELTNSFGGGLNSGQYGTVDINLDNELDLVVFDRSSDKFLTFISSESKYVYSPEYEYQLPTGIQNWVVFADYDCDGKKDIFTYTNLGIRVFKNTSVSQLSWELVEDPIFTQGTSSQVNLAVNSTDIPAIADLDGDDDLDILVFNFASGAVMQFHKNMSMENNGNCNSLEYIRVSQKYGDVEECSCDEFVFDGESCNDGGRVLHAGGKSILAFDQDGDGDLELVIGQEECNDISILENKGNANNPIFDSFSNLFPVTSTPLDLISFPSPFYEDVTFDGHKDIIVAPNLRSNPDGLIDNINSNLLYKNDGSGSFGFDRSNFLQEDMIDLGEFSYPAFVDVDGDSDDDLLIGNRGTWSNGKYASSIKLYTKTPEGFALTNEDYASLSQLNFTYINPSFLDINADGSKDLIFSAVDVNDDPGLFYLLNTSDNSELSFDISQIVTVTENIRAFDDAEMVDIDMDGTLDLLLAKTNGILEYYRNAGTNLSPNYALEDDSYLGLEFSSAMGNLNISIGDINDDDLLDLITTDRSGVARIYKDFRSENSEPISDIIKIDGAVDKLPTILGRITSPTIGQVNGRTLMVFGNIRGGITAFGSTNEGGSSSDQLSLAVFPNPSSINKTVKFNSPNEGVQLEIFGVSGNRLVGPVNLAANFTLNLDLSTYNNGLYFARIRKNKVSKTVKFIL